ncbi:very short patch repair endonuclease [Desulfobacula phenolica]|uniref:T/G mismatch-specific endonuclease n=1 Tax=Desulfobacula phenolica TaxID=90732 RepID=A0A1H2HJ12_9BACT|nr:very short patch repair endonuclease [Desulfobacula phenolica]SDU31867.1 T/G mismatch-specific endonuclease [Desulfobacula phenolica]
MDLFSPQKRSEIMSRIKSKGNASTEIKFETLLNKFNITGWEKHLAIIGKPDFVFPSLKIAIFIDGAFWHGYKSSKLPEKNRIFWEKKINSNKKRDLKVTNSLRKQGWSVIRIWDFELRKKNEKNIIKRIKRMITIKLNGEKHD